MPFCLGGGTGIRDGLKIRWWQHRVGSTPTPGTEKNLTESSDMI